MIYSKTCEYAVRALTYLALRERGVYAGASEVSAATGVPGPYVAKIFQSLARSGLLKSRRGIGGGVRLCRSAEKISLMQIVDAIDDLSPLNECAMGLNRCEDDNGCPMHEIWKQAKQEIISKFKQTKLMELARQPDKFKYGKTNRLRLKAAIS